MSNLRSVFIPSLLKLRCLILMSWFRAFVLINVCFFFYKLQATRFNRSPWFKQISSSPDLFMFPGSMSICRSILVFITSVWKSPPISNKPSVQSEYNKLNACFLSGTDLRWNLLPASPSLSIRRFWGKGERWKQETWLFILLAKLLNKNLLILVIAK